MPKPYKVVHDSQWGWNLLMAYIGAAVYFVHISDGFWGFVLALLKAAVWPAYILYAALEALKIQ